MLIGRMSPSSIMHLALVLDVENVEELGVSLEHSLVEVISECRSCSSYCREGRSDGLKCLGAQHGPGEGCQGLISAHACEGPQAAQQEARAGSQSHIVSVLLSRF